jgi:FAD/FMN-containing dehydrogenase
MDSISVVGDLARAHLNGPVIDPGHGDYSRLRRVHNGIIERQPAAIVQPTTASDVQKIVRIAADRGMPLAVRGGGHSFAGLGTCDDGIVCDLSRMNTVIIDRQARIAEVAGGALLGDVDAAGLKHGLVTPAGVVSHTGVGGLTLGGGMGYLSRRFGLTIDNLIGADIVTADGKHLRVSENEEPDLFWAIRGGGGNFGVVTKFSFRLHSLGPALIRRWTYPAIAAADILKRYREALRNSPRELSTAFQLKQDGLFLRVICSGLTAGAEAVVEPFGRFGGATQDPNVSMTFLELQRVADDSLPWGLRYYSKGGFLGEIDDRAVGVMAGSVAKMPVPGVEVYCLQLGGAVRDADEDATAYSGRAADHYWISQGAWVSPDDDEKAISWCRGTAGRLAALSLKANYVNEQADTGVARSAYGEAKYRRLAHLKWQYDPANLFRLNQNIEPRQLADGAGPRRP